MNSIIINLPYAGCGAPAALINRLGLTGDELRLENWRLADPLLAEIVREAATFEDQSQLLERPVVVNAWSPLVADPLGILEIERQKSSQRLARPKPAVLPESTAGRLIELSPADQDIVLKRAAIPFLQTLEEKVKLALESRPLVLVLTCRSYFSRPQGYEKSQKYPRPHACVTADPTLTPEALSNLAGNILRAFGWWPELNWPHEIAAPLPDALQNRGRVVPIGLSFSRDLYMDEKTGRRKPRAEAVARILRTMLNLFDQELSRVAARRIERFNKPRRLSPIIKAG